MEHILCFQSINHMHKNEIYTAIAVATFILVSIVWKTELNYRKGLFGAEKSIESKVLSDKVFTDRIQPHEILPDTTSEGYLGKSKTDLRDWSKKYGRNLKLMPI